MLHQEELKSLVVVPEVSYRRAHRDVSGEKQLLQPQSV